MGTGNPGTLWALGHEEEDGPENRDTAVPSLYWGCGAQHPPFLTANPSPDRSDTPTPLPVEGFISEN